jgi:hypothetical protein
MRISYRSCTSTVRISSTCCNPPSICLLGRRLGSWLGLGRRLGRRLWLRRLGLVNSSPFFYFLYSVMINYA